MFFLFVKDIEHGEFTLFLNYMAVNAKGFSATDKIDDVDGYAVGLLYEDKKIFEELFGMNCLLKMKNLFKIYLTVEQQLKTQKHLES